MKYGVFREKILEKLAWIKYAVYLVLEFEETLSKRRKSDHETSRINPEVFYYPAISANTNRFSL